MAAGVVPVVRSIPSGSPEVVRQGDSGLLVSDDPEQAAAALRALAEDPDLWQRCSAASRQLVEERFSRDHCHGQWLALVRQLRDTSKPSYPITGLHGMRFSKLSTRLATLKSLVKVPFKP